MPLGLGPPPGWNDGCVKAILTVARFHFPSMHIVDSVGDIRPADASGGHDELAVGTAGLMSLLDEMGARYHTKEGKRGWPTRLTHRLGFEVYTHKDVARMEERKVEKGLRLREGIFESEPGPPMQARDLLATGRARRVLPPAFWVERSERV